MARRAEDHATAPRERPAGNLMKNPKSALADAVREDFDRIALAEADFLWDHNRHYHRLIIERLPKQREAVLDIGCGSGRLMSLLAGRFRRVDGIDFSERMIERAGERLQDLKNVRLVCADARRHKFEPESYDCIVSAAAFHHLPLRALFPKLRAALRPGGALIVLDLCRPGSPLDWLLAALAVPANIAASLARNRGRRPGRAAQDAWKRHAPHDHYSTPAEIRRLAQSTLPDAEVRRLLYWRYLLVWQKSEAETRGRKKNNK